MKYGHLVGSPAAIQQKWSDLVAYCSADERSQLLKKSCEEYCVYLFKLQKCSDESVFKNIASLAKLILTFPHSNAETERIFSLMSDAKTKKRTRM